MVRFLPTLVQMTFTSTTGANNKNRRVPRVDCHRAHRRRDPRGRHKHRRGFVCRRGLGAFKSQNSKVASGVGSSFSLYIPKRALALLASRGLAMAYEGCCCIYTRPRKSEHTRTFNTIT